MRDARKAAVQAGYDAIGERYLRWSERIEGDPRGRFVADLAGRLPAGAAVLDVGCGPGLPSTRELAERFEVTGVDISEAQLALARAHVPGARFVHGDIAELDFPAASFAAIVALYSLTHVPREEHGELLARMRGWLAPGGLLLVTLAARSDPGSTGEWLGVPMFFSGHDADAGRALVRDAGFDVVRDEVVEMREPGGSARFLWLLGASAT